MPVEHVDAGGKLWDCRSGLAFRWRRTAGRRRPAGGLRAPESGCHASIAAASEAWLVWTFITSFGIARAARVAADGGIGIPMREKLGRSGTFGRAFRSGLAVLTVATRWSRSKVASPFRGAGRDSRHLMVPLCRRPGQRRRGRANALDRFANITGLGCHDSDPIGGDRCRAGPRGRAPGSTRRSVVAAIRRDGRSEERASTEGRMS